MNQFFSGTGNDEYALESVQLGGGAFTQALIQVSDQAANSGRVLWMHELVAKTAVILQRQAHSKQTPKLVTLSGVGEISFMPVNTAIRQKKTPHHSDTAIKNSRPNK